MKQSRYILAILSSLIVILLFGTGVVAGVIGDITGDGQVGIEDSIVALQVSAGISPAINVNLSADVNGNNRIGIEEAVYVLQRVAFLRIQRLSVGPEGGVLEFSNGVILDIPGGAVTEETEIGVPDIQCEQVNEILSAQGFASNERRCLGGFTGKPDGQEFLLPVTATVPILSLEPGEIPIQIKVNLDEQEYHLAPTNLRYLGEGAVAEMEIRGFSTNVVSASIQEETTPWTFPPPPCCLKVDDDPNSPTYGQSFLNTGKFEPDCCCFDGVFYQSEDSFLDGVKGDTYCAIAAKKTEVTLFKCPGQPKQTSWLQETRSDSDAMGNDGCPDDLKCKIDVQPSPEVDIFMCEEEKLEALISCDYKDGDPGLFSNADFEPFWRSSEETIAKVDPITGKVKGKGIGNATVEAAFAIPDPRFEPGDTKVNVKSNIDSFSVTPSQETITFPNEITLEADVVGATGISLDPSKVTWSSSNDDIAYVRQETGEWTTVVGMGKGTVIITAKYEYECETKVIWVDITVECPQITFQVNPPQGPLTVGEDFLLWAEVFDKDDNNLDASGVTWGLSGGDIDVVELPEDKTGPSIIITAKKPGSVDITATYDDGCQTSPLQETAQITVAEPIVSFLPYPHTIFAGDPPLTLEVEVKTHKGEIIECPSPIEWTFPDGIISLAVLSDDTKAEVAGVETGLAEIVATCEGGSGEANITVLGELVVAIDPDEKTINTGDSLPLTVNVSDDNGNPIPGGCPSDIEWTIPSGGIISFDYTNEIVTGVSEGTATITATCEGVSAQSIITVESGSGSEPPEPFTLYSIDVYPMDATICMDQGLQFSADLYDFYGSFLSGTVTWWSSDNSIANVDTVSGFVVGVTPGWVFIEARSEGVHGTTILNVAPGIQQSGTVTGHRAYWPIYAPVFRFSDYVEGLDYGWSFKFVVGSAQEPGINCYPNSCIVLKDVQDVSEICPNTLRFGYSPAVSYEVGDIVVFEFSEPPDFTAYYAAIRIDAVWSVPPTEGRSWIEWWVNFTWYYYGD